MSPSSSRNTKSSQPASELFFPIIFTVIALVATTSLVIVKTRASNEQANVVQEARTQVVAPTIDTETLTQSQGGQAPTTVGYQGALPLPSNPNQILLTSGAQSDPVTLEVQFTDTNGILSAIKQANASIKVVMAYGTSQVTDCTQAQLDGTSCWQDTFAGTDARVAANTQSLDEPHGTLTVPMTLPFFAKSGTWSVYYEIIPVDETGVAHPEKSVSNSAETVALRGVVGKLVAILVSPATVEYFKNGQTLAPQDISDPATITVTSQGNVLSYASIYGDPAGWTCDSGQHMSVDITHFKGGTGMTYAGADAQTLLGGDANRVRITDGVTAWTIPVSSGSQTGVVSTAGQNSFETMIKVPIVVGTCSTVATVLAEDASL